MYVIMSASPRSTGLTGACVEAAMAGITTAGGEVTHIDLCALNLGLCRQCGEDGWGTCRTDHACAIEDDLPQLLDALVAAQGVIMITPVYWGEPAEQAKCALDRLRRCEAILGEESQFVRKPIIAVAAAGGSGGGVLTCLQSMERFVQHTRAVVFDLIGITQRNRAYKLVTIREAAATMVGIQQEG